MGRRVVRSNERNRSRVPLAIDSFATDALTKCFGHRPSALKTSRGIALHRLLHHRREGARRVRRDLLERRRWLGEDLDEHLIAPIRFEGRSARHRIKEQRPHRPDIGASVDAFSFGLFGAHEMGGPHDHAGAGKPRSFLIDEVRDPEIEELGLRASLGEHQEHVFRLDVAVDDSDRMRCVERVEDFDRDLNHGVRRQGGLAGRPIEVLSLEELQREIQRVVVADPSVQDLADAGMADLGGSLRLSEKPLPRGVAFRDPAFDDLERDLSFGEAVLGFVDRAHASTPEESQELVAVGVEASDPCLRSRLCTHPLMMHGSVKETTDGFDLGAWPSHPVEVRILLRVAGLFSLVTLLVPAGCANSGLAGDSADGAADVRSDRRADAPSRNDATTGVSCAGVVCEPFQFCNADGVCEPYPPCVNSDECPEGVVCRNRFCLPEDLDLDGDGAPARDDCDESDPRVFPGAPEDCNLRDDDCDGPSDEGLSSRMCSSACGGGSERCEAGRWSGCNAVMPMAETCDGTDEDCDSMVDEGLVQACSTACGSGMEICIGGMFRNCSARAPVAETCDNTDQDCDGRTDEGVTRMCSSICGGGTETCVGGSFVNCSARQPTSETCEGSDQDCDGRIDEGLARACNTACGSGMEICVDGSFQNCSARAPVAETCDNTDQDCDGRTDESLTRSCSTACGMGTETCSGGSFQGCTAPAPRAELCNVVDDDCNGRCDDRGGCRRAVHRSFNGSSGEHFYTTSATEAACCGFTVEALNFYYLYSASQPGTVPFYRCLLSSGFHFYTQSSTCEGSLGARNEGTMGYIATSASVCGAVPLYRLVRGNDHFYTPSASERTTAIGLGYRSEGIAGYIWTSPQG